MADKATSRVHWSFWLISSFMLLWNGMGGLNFVIQMDPGAVAQYPESHRAIIEGRPLWATLGFAVAVFGGSLGCVLLLLRKKIASPVFVGSLIGVIVAMIHTFGVIGAESLETGEMIMMVVVPILVGVFLVWYSKLAASKGWLH